MDNVCFDCSSEYFYFSVASQKAGKKWSLEDDEEEEEEDSKMKAEAAKMETLETIEEETKETEEEEEVDPLDAFMKVVVIYLTEFPLLIVFCFLQRVFKVKCAKSKTWICIRQREEA